MALKPQLYYQALAAQTAAQNGPSTTVLDMSRNEDFVAELVVASGAGALDVSFEDSWDGITWGLWFALPQIQAIGVVRAAPARPPLGFVRRAQTIGAGTWAYTLRLVGEPKI